MQAALLSDAADFSQALSVFLIGGSLIYAGRQLAQLRLQVAEEARSRRIEATRSFLEQVSDTEVRRIRRWLLVSNDFDGHNLTERERFDVLRLAVTYDRVGLMLRWDLLDREMVLQWQGVEIVRLWALVLPVVAVERCLAGRERYCVHFQEMVSDFTRELRTNRSLTNVP